MKISRVVLTALCVALAPSAHASAPDGGTGAPAASAPAPPAAIPALDIPARAERTVAELYGLRTSLGSDPAVDRVVAGLPGMRADLEQLGSDETLRLDHVTARELEDVTRLWRRSEERLDDWARTVERRNQAIETQMVRVRQLDDLWKATAEAAGGEALPAAVMEQIAAVRGALRETRTSLQRQRDALLEAASQIGGLQTMVVDRLAQAELAGERLRQELLTIEAPPLWASLRGEPGAERPSRLAFDRTSHEIADFARDARGRMLAYLLLLLVVLGLATRIRRRAPSWPREAQTPALLRLASRPVSAAILLTALVAFVPGRNDPLAVSELVAFLLLLPLWRMLEPDLGGSLATLIPLLGALRVLGFVRQMAPALSPTARFLLLGENVAALVWVAWALREDRIGRTLDAAGARRLAALRRALAAVLLATIVANVVGNVSFAEFASRALAGAVLLGLGLWAGAIVAEGFIGGLLASRTVQAVRAVAYHTTAVRRSLLRAIRLAAPLAWLAGVLSFIGLLRPAVDSIRSMLGAHLRVGALSLSAGDLVAFALTLWVSLVLARIIRALLEEDVLPRLALPRGVPGAVSAAANYVIVLVGFLFAISAAGLDLSRVTILAGAFGVGIGFGLQNIVNNFVSGLILLFERLLQLGDVIEVGGISGSVRRIGIRSSTIQTFDGAEVIVPNATLIAERVTNWTATDHQRRLDVPVSITYGGDPEPVLALLRRVAAAHDDVLRQPAPEALLVGFGPGCLDLVLRVWVSYERSGTVRSDLVAAVDNGLREAGIALPQPTLRDVPAVRAASRRTT